MSESRRIRVNIKSFLPLATFAPLAPLERVERVAREWREDAAPSESRLDKLKAAFKPKENPAVGALRAEVAELREEVARLAARVEELSAAK